MGTKAHFGLVSMFKWNFEQYLYSHIFVAPAKQSAT